MFRRIILLALLPLAAAVAFAGNGDKEPGKNAAGNSSTANKKDAPKTFSERERATISSHYLSLQREAALYEQYHEPVKTPPGKAKSNQGQGQNSQSLPPGLQKKAEQGRLPPGWQKKLQVGAVLPPDILAVADPLPPRLLAQLPAGPVGTITVHVDGQIIRVLEATRTIVDVFGLNR